MKSQVKMSSVGRHQIWATATCRDKRQSVTEVPNRCVPAPGHLRPCLDFSEKTKHTHSSQLSYLHWSTMPTRRVSMLHPTPALISVNFTPWAMARLQPSAGVTTRVLAAMTAVTACMTA